MKFHLLQTDINGANPAITTAQPAPDTTLILELTPQDKRNLANLREDTTVFIVYPKEHEQLVEYYLSERDKTKYLREKTAAGLLDAKTALRETNGDVDKAIEYLKKKRVSDFLLITRRIEG